MVAASESHCIVNGESMNVGLHCYFHHQQMSRGLILRVVSILWYPLLVGMGVALVVDVMCKSSSGESMTGAMGGFGGDGVPLNDGTFLPLGCISNCWCSP